MPRRRSDRRAMLLRVRRGGRCKGAGPGPLLRATKNGNAHPSEVWCTAAPATPPHPPGSALDSPLFSFPARVCAPALAGPLTIWGAKTRPCPRVLVVVRKLIR